MANPKIHSNFSNWLQENGQWLALGFLFLILLGTRLLTGFNGLYGQDAHEYYRASKALHNFYGGGPFPGNFFWPLWYPFMGSVVSDPLWLLQGISLISIPLSAWAFSRILKTVFQAPLQLVLPFSLVFFAASPFFLRSGLLVMSDSLAVAFTLFSAMLFLDYREKGKGWQLGLLGFCAVAAFFTRSQTLLFTLPSLILALFHLFRRRHFSSLLWLIPLSILPVLPEIFLRPDDFLAFLENPLMENASLLNPFRRSFENADGKFSYRLPNLIWALGNLYHPGFLAIVFLGFLGLRKGDFRGKPGILFWAGGLFLYLILLSIIPFQNNRFLLLSHPFILLLLFPAWQRFNQGKWERFFRLVPIFMLPVQIAIFAWTLRQPMNLNHLEQSIALSVETRCEKGRIFTFGLEPALGSYVPEKEVVSMWKYELKTKNVKQGDWVLFNPEGFQKQWEGKNPMNNWNWLNANFELLPRESFAEGWGLYEIR